MKEGLDVIISKHAIIKRPHLCEIGNHVSIDPFVYCTTALKIGDYVHISPHVSIIGGEDGLCVLKGFNNITAGARIICSSDRFDGSGLFGALIPEYLKGTQITKPVMLEEFATIGSNAIVMPGSILRQGVLLTVGSMLMGDTEPWGVYTGNPAKLVKIIDGKETIKRAATLGYNYELKS